ncbi:MAG: hypothetical protein HC911_12050 [Chloroflexaceae bacterium]|nr:hypothetical protein [Chloroflexaceae bacterium]
MHEEQTAAKLGSLPDLPAEEPTQAELPAPAGDTAQIKKALHRLLALAEDGQLFRTPDGACYLSVDGQNLSLTRSEATREYVTLRYFEAYDAVPQDSSITGAIRILAARARTSAVRQLHSRIAHEGGSIWLDMGNRRAIQITPHGWQVVNDPPVLFRQAPGALPLPAPQRGGNLVELLRPLANVASETDLHLLAGWLVGTLVPTGAYAFLALSGRQGSGKTTLSTHLRNIIDPNESAVAAFPEKPEELTLIAREAGVLAFDNISRLNRNESDHLCRLSTGAAIRKRQLHTDADIVQISAKVPVILNGIPDLNGTAPDLDSRILAVMLVRRERNTPMRHVDAAFAAAHPWLLGAVCDAAATAMRSSYTAENLPRLADFTEWVERAAPALGWEGGYFTSLMEQQAEQHAAAAVENSTLARWLLDLLTEQQEWQGTATELRAALLNSKEAGDKHPLDFPKTPKLLAQELRRIESSLQMQDIEIGFIRRPGGRERIISLSFSNNRNLCVTASQSLSLPDNNALNPASNAASHQRHTSVTASHAASQTVPTFPLPPECLPPPHGSASSAELAERRAAALASLNGESSTFIACLNAGDWEQIKEIIAAAKQDRGLLSQIYQQRKFSQENAAQV